MKCIRGKHIYLSREAAKIASSLLTAKYGIQMYVCDQCKRCKGWHLTKMPTDEFRERRAKQKRERLLRRNG